MKRWLRRSHPQRCAWCGRPLDMHGEQRDVRYKLPDLVWDVPETEQGSRLRWGGDDFLAFDRNGTFETGHSFIRVLLPSM